jgi:hypothetical protein
MSAAGAQSVPAELSILSIWPLARGTYTSMIVIPDGQGGNFVLHLVVHFVDTAERIGCPRGRQS